MLLNSACPFNCELVLVVGAGGAESRMNPAKVHQVGRSGAGRRRRWWCGLRVWSLKTQPATAERSLGNASFDTPLLDVVGFSRENFERFILRFPSRSESPCRRCRSCSAGRRCPARIFEMRWRSGSPAESRPECSPRGQDQTPESEFENLDLWLFNWKLKSGCARLQPGASLRPLIVYRP